MTKKTSESGWAIPDDWDGQSWRCVALQWPDSPKFEILLRGLLYSLTRGRAYDGFTGSVLTAKTYGWLIFDHNDPLISCADSPDCPECPQEPPGRDLSPVAACGGLVVEDDGNMGQVVTDVTLNDQGQIVVWFGPCCSKVLAGLTAVGTVPNVGDDPLDPNGEGGVDYYACGKATAIVTAVFKVLEGTHEALNGNFEFWQWISAAETYVGYDLGDSYMTALIAALKTLGAIWSPEEVWTTIERQNAICKIADYFSDDAVGVPDMDAFYTIKGMLSAGAFFPDQGFVNLAYDALGRANLDAIAKWGAQDDTSNCDCPAQASSLIDVTDGWIGCDWSHWFDFTLADKPEWVEDIINEEHWFPGWGLCYYPAGSGSVDIRLRFPITTDGGTVTHVYMYYNVRCCDYYGGGTDIKAEGTMLIDFPGTGWYDSNPSMGGNITVQRTDLSAALSAAGDDDMNFGVEYDQPDPVDPGPQNAVRVMAIAIGGTGTDPWTDHFS